MNINPKDPYQINQELYEQIQAMLDFATSNAIKLPEELGPSINTSGTDKNITAATQNVSKAAPDLPGPTPDLPKAGTGEDLKGHINDIVQYLNTGDLLHIHQQLSDAISPALPSTVTLIYQQQKEKHPLYFLGSVPLLRNLSLVTLTFLLAFICVGLRPEVNAENIAKGFLNSNDLTLLWNQLFLICASGLGACFANLFKLIKYVTEANYDPRFISTYWARIILGIISGIIIAELIPVDIFGDNQIRDMTKPTMALFGGFSADVVFIVLTRIVDSLKTLVRGNMEDTIKNEKDSMSNQLKSQMTGKLLKLQEEIQNMGDANDPKQISAKISKLLKEI